MALAVGLVAYTAHAVTGLGGDAALFEDWVYDALLAICAVLVVARGLVAGPERAAWLVLGAGLSAWAAGLIAASVWPDLAGGTFPSAVDGLWLVYYPAAYAALVLFVRARVQRFYVSLWVDGLVGALALSALVAALAVPALVGEHGNSLLADVTYPVLDVSSRGFVLWVGALTQWRPGRVLGLVGGAMLAGALVDFWSLWTQLTVRARWRRAWTGSARLRGGARPGRLDPARAAGVIRLSGMRPLAPPVLFAGSSLSLLLVSRLQEIQTTAFLLAQRDAGRRHRPDGAHLRREPAHGRPQPARGAHRPADRARQPPPPDGGPGRGLPHGGRGRPVGPRRVRPRRLQALQRHARPPGRRRAARGLGRRSRRPPARRRLPPRRRRVLRAGAPRRQPARGRRAPAQPRAVPPRRRLRRDRLGGRVALPTEAADPSEALRIADDRLYAAKRARRGAAEPLAAVPPIEELRAA